MSVIQQNLEKLTVVAGVATAAVTSTATSSAIDLLEYDGDVVLILDSAAGGGSSPTLDIKITAKATEGASAGDKLFGSVTKADLVEAFEKDRELINKKIGFISYGSGSKAKIFEGTIQKDQPIRVLRDNTVIYEGELESLRRFKEDVKEVKSGTECGIGVKDYNDIKSGDQIEVYKRTEIKRSI